MNNAASTSALTRAARGLAVAWVALGGPAAAGARGKPEMWRETTHIRTFGPAQTPNGAVRFCGSAPEECKEVGGKDAIDLTVERFLELDEVNREVNFEVKPATDLEVYGLNEYWTLPRLEKRTEWGADGHLHTLAPARRGDCEDYALLKRHDLIAKGWPSSTLLMTVVRDERGEGHAVLMARTKQGDFVLDNKAEEVKPWTDTPYLYVMRQSYLDPKVWVALDTRTSWSTVAKVEPPKAEDPAVAVPAEVARPAPRARPARDVAPLEPVEKPDRRAWSGGSAFGWQQEPPGMADLQLGGGLTIDFVLGR